MRYREEEEPTQSIDITPMVDIVFLLLIFFMVSTTFVKDMEVDIERPTAVTGEKASTDAIRIYIDESGATYMNGEPVRIWTIQSRVRDLLEVDADRPVLVVTDQAVSAGRLIEVVDQARLAGATDVGVATEREAGS